MAAANKDDMLEAGKEHHTSEILVPIASLKAADVVEVGGLEEKKLVRRIDMWILPMLASLSFLNYLDKLTLGSTAVLGIIKDLHLTGTQFSWCNSIFYFGYFAFTWISSYLLVRLPLGKYLASTLFFWAVLVGVTAACQNFGGLSAVRFLLGCAEAAILPGSGLITGMWYKREEHPLRTGVWFLGTSIGVMCGGLLAYAIAHISGGIGPWRWLFIIFGLVTIVWAAVLNWILPDTPDTAHFLSKEQKAQTINRIRVNQQGVKDDGFKWYQAREALLDLKVWLPGLIACSLSVTNGALTAFNAIIVVSFGFTRLQAYLFNIAIGGIHAFFLLSSYICTRFRNKRCFVLLGLCTISFMGSLIVRLAKGKGPRLFGFLCYFAFVPGISISLSFITSNTAGFTKKSASHSLFTIAYCTGNIVGPSIFLAREAPTYTSGYNGVIGCFVAAFVFTAALLIVTIRTNRRRDRLFGRQENSPTGRIDEDQLPALHDQTDGEKDMFRYVY